MKSNAALVVTLAVVLVGAGVYLAVRPNGTAASLPSGAPQATLPAPASTPQHTNEPPHTIAPTPEAATPAAPAPHEADAQPAAPSGRTRPAPADRRTNTGAPTVQPAKPAKELADPIARVALRFVGTDSFAEGYWFTAINNPALPANERSDLIEDLNEDGLSDPDHPGRQDLPLIESRIRLIERLAPLSMDHVNAAAFREAYKDLTEMYDRLTSAADEH